MWQNRESIPSFGRIRTLHVDEQAGQKLVSDVKLLSDNNYVKFAIVSEMEKSFGVMRESLRQINTSVMMQSSFVLDISKRPSLGRPSESWSVGLQMFTRFAQDSCVIRETR